MATFNSSLFTTVILLFVASRASAENNDERVAFDMPSAIECRDVTTREFSLAHPNQRLVEGKLRVSARMLSGDATNVLDFEYFAKTGSMMRVQDYQPKTTLESSVDDDKIEITAAE